MEAFQKIAEKVKMLMAKKWGWVVTIAAFWIFSAAFGTMYSFGILLVELQEEFSSGASETGWSCVLFCNRLSSYLPKLSIENHPVQYNMKSRSKL